MPTRFSFIGEFLPFLWGEYHQITPPTQGGSEGKGTDRLLMTIKPAQFLQLHFASDAVSHVNGFNKFLPKHYNHSVGINSQSV